MKKFIKNISIIVLCLLLAVSMTACADSGTLIDPLPYLEDFEVKKAETFVAAENEQYQLKWDAENKRVIVYDKPHDVIWSSTPNDALTPQIDENGYEITNNPRIEAPIMLSYIETQTFTVKNANAYVQCFNRGDYALEKIDNGIKITYHFESLEIIVPVVYTLNEDSFSISVLTEEICESGLNRVYRISIAPYMCSVPNLTEDAYLFHPSGTGALIYTNREYQVGYPSSYQVYGEDGLYIPLNNAMFSNTESVKLPVYGYKNGNRALMAVISKGAELAAIETDIGDAVTGYTTIYSSYTIRGIQTTNKAMENSTQYSENYALSPIEVTYYPLYDENANYVSMAKTYRSYLEREKNLKDLEEDASLSLSMIGGTKIPASFLGIPTSKLYATTTIKQAGEIIKDLDASIDIPIVADLFGFGASGVDVGKPGGGLTIGSSIGTEKQLKALSEECKNNGTELYFNYDMINFSSNGSGLTTANGGSAKDPSHLYSRKYAFFLGQGSTDTNNYYYLVSRLELIDFANKAISHSSSLGVTGITSHNISSVAYSDFADNKYIGKGNMANDVTAIFNDAKEANLKVLGYSANEYAAVASDRIIEVPLTSNKYNFFDVDVPFYQLVFKGYVSMYGTALNTVTDENLAILRSIEAGTGLRYSVINNYDVDLATSEYQIFGTRLYSDLKDKIVERVNETSAYYKAIEDAKMLDHVIVNENVRKVVYDNGVIVYVNYGDSDYESEIGTVSAKSYSYREGEN